MKIFQPQNEKGEKLVPLIIETEKIDNKYLDLENLSEQLASDGAIKTELDSLDARIETVEDTLDDEVNTHINNSAIHFELADTIENQSTKAVTGKAVSTYVSGQNFVKSLNAKEIRVYTDPNSAPPLEEREDGVLYLCKTVTQEEDYSTEIDELKQQIHALTEQLATYATQSYVDDNFIRGKVVDSQDKVEDKGDDYTYIIASNK